MRRTIATVGVVGLGMLAATVSANAAPPEEEKSITICHATNDGFLEQTISLSALHGHTRDTGDIVPVNSGNIMPQGQNLSTANLAFLARGCVAAAVPPADPPVDPPADPPADPGAGDQTPGTDTTQELAVTPESAVTPLSPAVVAPNAVAPAAKTVAPAAKTAAPAAKKTNVGYNVQTAVGRTSDAGVPTWLLALTGVFTAGAAAVLWSGRRRARTTED